MSLYDEEAGLLAYASSSYLSSHESIHSDFLAVVSIYSCGDSSDFPDSLLNQEWYLFIAKHYILYTYLYLHPNI